MVTLENQLDCLKAKQLERPCVFTNIQSGTITMKDGLLELPAKNLFPRGFTMERVENFFFCKTGRTMGLEDLAEGRIGLIIRPRLSSSGFE